MENLGQLDLFGHYVNLFAEDGEEATGIPPAAHREKRYNDQGPELQMTSAEVDQFCRVGHRKLALVMFMQAVDDVAYAQTPEAREAALAYFQEDDGPLPFGVVLEWLGPPLADFPVEAWAAHIRANPDAAHESVRRYYRDVGRLEVGHWARGTADRDDAGTDVDTSGAPVSRTASGARTFARPRGG